MFNLPKESFEDVYIPNGYIDVVKASHMINDSSIHGKKIIGFESPVCSEVDSVEEFDYIQYQLKRKGSPLLDYLNNNY